MTAADPKSVTQVEHGKCPVSSKPVVQSRLRAATILPKPSASSTAHALYQQIIAPVPEALQGKRHVFFAASGSLSGLPFGMLVSEMPAGQTGDPDVLRSAAWFGNAHALFRISLLQSLADLRKYRSAVKPASGKPFVGFGDPEKRRLAALPKAARRDRS